ncbi:MAG: DUF4404 family protein [Pseudohongiellaceae bacterium]|nr:DUF4404 family protein [Pseudohongiellaceae bacterium]
MSKQSIKDLAGELQRALNQASDIDEETLDLVRKLDKKIDNFIEEKEDVNSPLLDDAIALEARFSVSHPMIEKICRELIDTLGRMGI